MSQVETWIDQEMMSEELQDWVWDQVDDGKSLDVIKYTFYRFMGMDI